MTPNNLKYKDSYFSYKFVTDSLTKSKTNLLWNHADYILDCRNILSIYLNNHLNEYMCIIDDKTKYTKHISKFDFAKDIHSKFKCDDYFNKCSNVNSNFEYQLITDVYVNYTEKYDVIINLIKFHIVSNYSVTYYKKNTKKHKTGDVKSFVANKKHTALSNTLSYLAHYGNEYTVDIINNELTKKLSSEKAKFYKQILNHIDKFGFERLYALASAKRQRYIKKYFAEPIYYEKHTFRGRCRKINIIEKNVNKKSKIKTFIILSGIKNENVDKTRGKNKQQDLIIPVKYSNEFYGNIDEFNESHKDFVYTITFDEYSKKATIILSKEEQRLYAFTTDVENVRGLDVNTKHELLRDSKNNKFDIKRDLLYDYIAEVKKTYELKKLNPNYKIGKQRRRKLNTLMRKMLHREQDLIAMICKQYQAENVTHIALEELTGSFGKCFIKKTIQKLIDDNEQLTDEERTDLEEKINLNIVTSLLHISSLKDEFVHIAAKYGIVVSFVQSAYTSQRCPVCGAIHKENRQTQENFVCIECGYKANADYNAAINIRNRVVEAVLRVLLLKQNPDDGSFRPISNKKSKEIVRKALDSVRYNVSVDARDG